MSDRGLQWRPGRTVAASPDGNEVWMLGGQGPIRLAGRGAGPLARSIDVGGDADTIIERAARWGLPADRGLSVLDKWLASGHVVEVVERTTPGPVSVRIVDATDGLGDAELLAGALRAVGVSVGDPSAELVVVVPHALALGIAGTGDEPYIGVCLRGPRALVTSLLVPGERGRCPACLGTRLEHRQSTEAVAARRLGLGLPPAHPLVNGPAVAAACAAAVAGTASSPASDSRITAFDMTTSTMERHVVVPVPGCPGCDPGGAIARMRHLDGPLALAAESFDDGGSGYRTVDPEDTWDDHAHLVNDVVGLVPHVTPGPLRELRAYISGTNAAALDDPVAFRSKLRSYSGGKGITRSGARTGALAEALERSSMRTWDGREPSRRARMSDLEGAIHPNDIDLFSEAQLQRSAGLAAFGLHGVLDDSGNRPVPLPFDVEAEHDWSPVADLRTGEVHWLPSSLLWFDWPGLAPGSYRGTSNGAAAGNTLEEAVLQGLLELVERDSVALWWHPMCQRPAFDLQSWNDARIAAALAPQQLLGTDVWVLDLTSDLGIPAAAAVARGIPGTKAPLLGFGAHVDPAIAVVRALTELAQMQSAFTHGFAEVLEHAGPGEKRWFLHLDVDNEPWLAPHGLVPPPAAPSHPTIGHAIDDVVSRIEAAGMSVLWADASRPDTPLSVVRTFAPGMRHFWNQFAQGRLFEVPPQLGWRDGGYGEDDLNPWAMIL